MHLQTFVRLCSYAKQFARELPIRFVGARTSTRELKFDWLRDFW